MRHTWREIERRRKRKKRKKKKRRGPALGVSPMAHAQRGGVHFVAFQASKDFEEIFSSNVFKVEKSLCLNSRFLIQARDQSQDGKKIK